MNLLHCILKMVRNTKLKVSEVRFWLFLQNFLNIRHEFNFVIDSCAVTNLSLPSLSKLKFGCGKLQVEVGFLGCHTTLARGYLTIFNLFSTQRQQFGFSACYYSTKP